MLCCPVNPSLREPPKAKYLVRSFKNGIISPSSNKSLSLKDSNASTKVSAFPEEDSRPLAHKACSKA